MWPSTLSRTTTFESSAILSSTTQPRSTRCPWTVSNFYIFLWFFIKCQCICWLTNNVPCFSGGSHLVETWRGQKQLARRSIFVLYCTNYIARNSSAWVAPARPLKSLAYQAVDTDLWGLALEALCVEEWQSTRIGVCSPGYRRTLQGDIAWALLATQVTLHNNLRDAPDIRLAG